MRLWANRRQSTRESRGIEHCLGTDSQRARAEQSHMLNINSMSCYGLFMYTWACCCTICNPGAFLGLPYRNLMKYALGYLLMLLTTIRSEKPFQRYVDGNFFGMSLLTIV